MRSPVIRLEWEGPTADEAFDSFGIVAHSEVERAFRAGYQRGVTNGADDMHIVDPCSEDAAWAEFCRGERTT